MRRWTGAESWNRRRPLGVSECYFWALFLANDILGTPIPHEIKQKAQHDQLTADTRRTGDRRLLEGSLIVPGDWERTLFGLQLMERVQDRISYCCPYANDCHTCGLEQSAATPILSFLYIMRSGLCGWLEGMG